VDDSASGIGVWNDIVMDDDDNPRISYIDDNSDNLKYAEWTGSTWSVTGLDSDAQEGPTAIVLDLQGYPHILYRNGSGDLYHAYRDSGGWSREAVDSTYDDYFGYGLDLAIDRFGNLHAAYYYSPGADLYYIKGTTGSWGSAQALDTFSSVGRQPSIAVDYDGNPHIVYGNATGYDLMYITSTDGGTLPSRVAPIRTVQSR